ncbi:MAG: argininosuccinate synthase [Betaproteobacteria bacterium]|nr:argininosuccinate synthase [Betaproteobacteria bacterium]
MPAPQKVVLAYSGGLDTSVILKWLMTTYGCEIITMTADLGQPEDLSGVEAKALKTGAVKAYVEDLKEEFARDFVFPMLRSGASYEGRYLLGTSIARPLIAKRLVDIALREGADAVAHGATGKGNDQVRFEFAVNALAPQLRVIAPWREWDLMSRTALNAFADAHGIPISASQKRYSMDSNMLHNSFEGAELEDPSVEPHETCYYMSRPMATAPDEPEYLELEFEQGNPVAIDGTRLSPAKLLLALNDIGARHGVGRLDMVENRFVGMKSHGVYETPGGTIIRAAHRDLEGICMDREVMRIRDTLAPSYAAAVYNGYWFAPEREAMQAFMDAAQKWISGTVRVKLFKGGVWPVGRSSPNTLYCHDLATFEECAAYDHKDAAGFIRLNALRLTTFGAMRRRAQRS